MVMFLILFLISMTFAICDQAHTTVYTEFGNTFNTNNRYFVSLTYKGGSNENSQRDYSEKDNNQEFRNQVAKNSQCVGEWCKDKDPNKWGCIQYKTQDCYNAEHIIAKASIEIPALDGCPASTRDIAGNLIMAYGKWNSQLSNSHINEKVEIYGADIVKSAYDAVYLKCKGEMPSSYPPELCLNAGSSSYMWIIIVLVGIVLIVCGVYYYYTHHYQKTKRDFDSPITQYVESSSDESIELDDKLPNVEDNDQLESQNYHE